MLCVRFAMRFSLGITHYTRYLAPRKWAKADSCTTVVCTCNGGEGVRFLTKQCRITMTLWYWPMTVGLVVNSIFIVSIIVSCVKVRKICSDIAINIVRLQGTGEWQETFLSNSGARLHILCTFSTLWDLLSVRVCFHSLPCCNTIQVFGSMLRCSVNHSVRPCVYT